MTWVTGRTAFLALSLAPCLVFAADKPNEVSFKLYRGYAIVVHGSVGNLKNLNFLVDTGAVPSVLDERIARKLHLTGTTEKLSVFTETVETQRALAQDLRVGPLRAEALPVVVRDLSFAGNALGNRVDAMLGFDFLGRGPFTIDYQRKKIVFGAIDASLTLIPYEARPGYALIVLKVQQTSLRLLLDTGASDLVLFATATRDCQDSIKELGRQAWSNMGGDIPVQKVNLRDAYLGSMPWGVRDAFILPDRGIPPAGVDGLLGIAALKAHRVGFDPEHKMLAWDGHGR